MQSIIEIKEILERLNQRERKAAKKYFSVHYSNTKELKLFSIIEESKGKQKYNLENRICKMGYESSESKAFQKLKTRLKHKLFDYLATSVSISEIRNIDSHSFLIHRLKKFNFQAGVLIEKGFFMQANELLRTSLRLAQDFQQIPEIIEALKCLHKIEKLHGNSARQESILSKLSHFSTLLQRINEIEHQFNALLSILELKSMDSILHRTEELMSNIAQKQDLTEIKKVQLMHKYLSILLLQSRQNYHEAFMVTTSTIRHIQAENSQYDVRLKMLFYSTMVELLLITGHPTKAIYFLNHRSIQSKPVHLKQRLFAMYRHFIIGRSEQILGEEYAFIDGPNKLIHEYLLAHMSFNVRKFKKCMEYIDQCIRKFTIQSLQQLDLMVLEMMCFFELEQYELLEYKLQSFLKNLAYRGTYEVPVYYHKIYKIMNALIKCSPKNDSDLFNDFWSTMKTEKPDGLFALRSMQPAYFTNWLFGKIHPASISKAPISMHLNNTDLLIDRVA